MKVGSNCFPVLSLVAIQPLRIFQGDCFGMPAGFTRFPILGSCFAKQEVGLHPYTLRKISMDGGNQFAFRSKFGNE